MFFAGSRAPSQWLGQQAVSAAAAYEQGNALNRGTDLVLILLAIGILISRSFKWGVFFRRNSWLVAYISFALLSVLWSDFASIAFKRWFRDLGDYFVILVILSDPRPLEAVRTVLRRVSYLLIPLSILLIRYYSALGRQYNAWTGMAEYVGATTSKNMLGIVCLVSGLFFFWDTLERWSARGESRTRRIILVNVAFFMMTLWVLHLSNSATSRLCLLVGCLVIAAAHTKAVKRHPRLLTAVVPACLCLYLGLNFGLGIDINGWIAEHVGRNPTLTDRTVIWKALLDMHTSLLTGTGYASFWLGPRLQWVWSQVGAINEAHNGYLEVYLNLGLIGICILAAFVISAYRIICERVKSLNSLGSFAFAVWTVFLFHNVTEADFRSGFFWLVFLMAALAIPEVRKDRETEDPTSHDTETGESASVPVWETMSERW